MPFTRVSPSSPSDLSNLRIGKSWGKSRGPHKTEKTIIELWQKIQDDMMIWWKMCIYVLIIIDMSNSLAAWEGGNKFTKLEIWGTTVGFLFFLFHPRVPSMYMSRFANVPFNALQISIKKLLDVLSHVKHKSTVEAGVIQHSGFLWEQFQYVINRWVLTRKYKTNSGVFLEGRVLQL